MKLEKRVKSLNHINYKSGCVIYWMSRDQRIDDNWSLLYAQHLALEKKVPLIVIFCLLPSFIESTIRHYVFLIKGLQELEGSLDKSNIPFVLLKGDPVQEVIKFTNSIKAGAVITDFDPLRIKQNWKIKLKKELDIPFIEVDSHNIVPCWIASPKQEYGAYTIRPKIKKLLPEYLEEFPTIQNHPYSMSEFSSNNDWDMAYNSLNIDQKASEINWLKPGEKEAKKTLEIFINEKLHKYAQNRNDPNKDATSNLSPYIHFGQISAHRIALEINKAEENKDSKDSFLEELIVRRELSDNFCFYNENYDNINGLPNWAKTTLEEHKRDIRAYNYTLEELEHSKTHDDLWNAAQKEMVYTAKMSGYMRMYWAKKILEWTTSPEEAIKICIYLNNRYELDGRDPNGYVGVLWSIGGLHDRAWKEREVFGKVRYMSYNGCKSKFDIKAYIAKNNSLLKNI